MEGGCLIDGRLIEVGLYLFGNTGNGKITGNSK